MFTEKDCLNRTKDIEAISNIINSMNTLKEYGSFALNGGWGTGKTYFLNMLKEKYEKDYLFIIYDAWQNNFYEEPLIGLLDCVLKNLEESLIFEQIANTIIKETLRCVISALDALIYSTIRIKPFEKLRKLVAFKENKRKELYSFNDQEKICQIKRVAKAALQKLSEEIPIILIIDELDRCNPSYALRVLERVHHIKQEQAHIISIYSVDKKQLNNFVNTVYPCHVNDDNNADDYLRKFINFTYKLDKGKAESNKKAITERMLSLFKDEFYDQAINEKQFDDFVSKINEDVGIRSFKKIINMCLLLHKLVFKDEKHTKELLAFEIFYVYCNMIGKTKSSKLIIEYLDGKQSAGPSLRYRIEDLTSLIGFMHKKQKYPFAGPVSGPGYIIKLPHYIDVFYNEFVPLIGKIDL